MGQMRVILCTVIVLTILVFGSVFYESIHPTIEAQLPTTLKITKLTTGGDDTFDFTVTGPTSYNPSITTSGSGIGTNTGSFGGSATYFEDDIETPFISITGILNQGIFQKGQFGVGAGEDGYIQIGSPSQWSYHTTSGPQLTSFNFWIKGDVATFSGGGEGNNALISTMNAGTGDTDGIILSTVEDGMNLVIKENDNYVENTYFDGQILPPDDGEWHMITLTMDKSKFDGTLQDWAILCVDTSCKGNNDITGTFTGDGNTAPNTLTIAGLHYVENPFDMQYGIDDLSIWHGYILTPIDISNLYNSGVGQVGSSIQPASQVVSLSFDTLSAGSGIGIGMDGPTPVDSGTYSIQESIPAGWNLNTATCNDGSSSFSVDTISGIVIDPDANIECTFVNAFVGSTPDTDLDGIFNDVDTLPNTISDDFSDIPLGGTSSGTITTRGDQILTITEETNPSGVRIAADVSGGLLPAIVNACGGLSLITLSSEDEVVVTCGSITIDVINGPVDVAFISSGGTQATTSLSAGNSITFDQDKFSFVTPPTNTQTIIIDVEGTPITIGPGDTNTSQPEVGTIIASQDPIQAGTLVTASAAFTDLGPLETHTAQWDWGDLTTSSGVVSENGLSGTVTGSHTYSTPGVYTVTLTVTDDTGDSGSSTFQFVVIYDPSGGFVTGGGWIDSPEGAYVAEPLLVGKATFGFVSKYQQDANVPTGNTQFSFQVADLKFKSTEYDWLVVAGSNAKFKGTGTINGQGNYGFQLFGFDADVNTNDSHLDDKFRIKIWDKNNGDVVVYDNELVQSEAAEPSTIIGGGSIVIHKP